MAGEEEAVRSLLAARDLARRRDDIAPRPEQLPHVLRPLRLFDLCSFVCRRKVRDGHARSVNVGFNLMSDYHPSSVFSRPQFPAHNEPRVWVVTAGDSPIGISVTRQILAHGDYALIGLAYSNLDRDECRRDGFEAFMAEVENHHDEEWGQRLKSVPLDIRCALFLRGHLMNNGLSVVVQDDG